MDVKELEALASLVVNVRKLAKFQKQDHKDRLYPSGAKERSSELFNIYNQLIDQLILHSKNYLNPEPKIDLINGGQHRGTKTENTTTRSPKRKTNPRNRSVKKAVKRK